MHGHSELVKDLETLALRMDDGSLTQDEMDDATDVVLDATQLLRELPTFVLTVDAFLRADRDEYAAHSEYLRDRDDKKKLTAWITAADRRANARLDLLVSLADMDQATRAEREEAKLLVATIDEEEEDREFPD